MHDKKTQDLLDLLEDNDPVVEEVPQPEKESDVDKFIRDIKLTVGEDRVPAMCIYHTYCLWRRNRRVGRVTFFRRFSSIFDNKIISGGETSYLLDNSDNLFDTTIEGKFAARKFLRISRRRRGEKYKKADKKK